MKKKLKEEAGFTLVEMLAATAILILLTMMLGTGLQMTVHSYQKIIAQSEVDLMLSTAIDALADDLRFAREVKAYDDTAVPFIYTSDSFLGKIHLEIGTDGQIIARDVETGEGNKRFLSTGAYGARKSDGNRAYKVTTMDIQRQIDPETNANTFTIALEVQAVADENIKASGEVTVRCLNEIQTTE